MSSVPFKVQKLRNLWKSQALAIDEIEIGHLGKLNFIQK